MKYVKNQAYNTHYQSSTIPKGTMASLGTIEKDACSHYGKHNSKPFQGFEILEYAVSNLSFTSVLDIGAGEGLQSSYLASHDKDVYKCDFDNIDGVHCSDSKNDYEYKGDFVDINFDKKFDFVLASHVLEHQRNVGKFIDKMIDVAKPNGYICIVVPIRKPFITGGHLTIWNPGLLLYNLVAAGLDCSECYLRQIDYDIGVLIRVNRYNKNNHKLTYDRGDIDLLSRYFPMPLTEPFNGDIMKIDRIRCTKNEDR